jgi:hypothetical protein
MWTWVQYLLEMILFMLLCTIPITIGSIICDITAILTAYIFSFGRTNPEGYPEINIFLNILRLMLSLGLGVGSFLFTMEISPNITNFIIQLWSGLVSLVAVGPLIFAGGLLVGTLMGLCGYRIFLRKRLFSKKWILS